MPNGDCSGLNCDLEPGLAEEYDVVFSVNKCVDPVSVNMTIFHGGLSQQVVEQSQRIYLGGSQSLAVQMSRNATDLNFAVSFCCWFCVLFVCVVMLISMSFWEET